MAEPVTEKPAIWLAAGVRTPFLKPDQAFAGMDSIALSVPVAQHMVGLLNGGKPDFAVWGAVIPSLTWSNIAREVLMDARLLEAADPAGAHPGPAVRHAW